MKNLLPQVFNTIQSNLLTEYIQDQFLKDCTLKHVGTIVSYKGFYGILTLIKLYLIVISIEYCPIVGDTLHRDTAYVRGSSSSNYP